MRFPRVHAPRCPRRPQPAPISGPFPGIFPTNLKEARSYEYQAQDTEMLRILPSGTKGAYRIGRMPSICQRQRDPETWEGLQRSSRQIAIR
jgi:hypothetical protein